MAVAAIVRRPGRPAAALGATHTHGLGEERWWKKAGGGGIWIEVWVELFLINVGGWTVEWLVGWEQMQVVAWGL